MARIVYVQLWCTDPDWDETSTEQTDIYYFPSCLFIFKKGVIFTINLCIY